MSIENLGNKMFQDRFKLWALFEEVLLSLSPSFPLSLSLSNNPQCRAAVEGALWLYSSGSVDQDSRSLRLTAAALQPAWRHSPPRTPCTSKSSNHTVFCLAWGGESLQDHFLRTERQRIFFPPLFFPTSPFLSVSPPPPSLSHFGTFYFLLLWNKRRCCFHESTCSPSTHEFR